MQYDDNKKASPILIKMTAGLVFSLCILFSQASYAEDKPGAPETEKLTCYDKNGVTTDCPAKEAVAPFGIPVFQDNGNGTVTDFQTRLTWQQDTVDTNGDGAISSKDTRTWKAASGYCDKLEMADKDDWRLPAVEELNTIVSFDKKFPAIQPPFTSQSSHYWSSTDYIYKKPKAWSVSFYFGNSAWSFKSSKFFLRCVRGGQGE